MVPSLQRPLDNPRITMGFRVQGYMGMGDNGNHYIILGHTLGFSGGFIGRLRRSQLGADSLVL